MMLNYNLSNYSSSIDFLLIKFTIDSFHPLCQIVEVIDEVSFILLVLSVVIFYGYSNGWSILI